MGQIPSTQNMISTVITNPQAAQDIAANTDFDLECTIQGLQAGSFTNPDSTYYSAPQELNKQGQIIGHTHFTVQDMAGNMNPKTPLDPNKFAFFKGVNDAGDGKGNLKVTVTGGLPAGTYRVCTMTSASNHQPVLMPIAQ
jgi:transcription initiation factor TFIID subunit 15